MDGVCQKIVYTVEMCRKDDKVLDPMLGECSDACPTNRPIDANTGACQVCDPATPYWDPLLNKCVTECILYYNSPVISYFCSDCDDIGGGKYWEPALDICVDRCITGELYAGTSLCKTCEDINPETPKYEISFG